MNKNKGFTLVELLSVIIVLSLIMVLAIPAILHILDNAKKESFYVYANNVYEKAVNKYVQNENDASVNELACSVYRIPEDLDISNSGDYQGWVKVVKEPVGSGNYEYSLNISNPNGLYSVKYCTKYNADCNPEENDTDATYSSDYWSVKEDVYGIPDTETTIKITKSKDYHLCVQYQYPNGSGTMQKSEVLCNYTSNEILNDNYEYKVILTMKDKQRAVENFVIQNNKTDTDSKDHNKQAMFAAIDEYKNGHNMSEMPITELVCSGTGNVISNPNNPVYTYPTTTQAADPQYTNPVVNPDEQTRTSQVITQSPITRQNSILISNISIEGYDLRFSPTRLTYEITVPHSVTSVNVNYTKASDDVKVDIKGANSLNVGTNVIVVHAWKDSTNEEVFYYITVNRRGTVTSTRPQQTRLPVNTTIPTEDIPDASLPESNAKLYNILIAGYDLNDLFKPDVFAYDIEIDPFVTELQITPVLQQPGARYSISDNNNLQEGSKISITVYSQNGYYHNVYIINVHVKKKTGNIKVLLYVIAAALGGVLIVLLVMIKKQKDQEAIADSKKQDISKKTIVIKPLRNKK